MTRALRILQSTDNLPTVLAVAPPPEAVALESDFVVILAALLCALICVVGLIAVAWCAWLWQVVGVGNSAQQALANKGLKKKVLQSLPKFAYIDSNPSKSLATSKCAIFLLESVLVCLLWGGNGNTIHNNGRKKNKFVAQLLLRDVDSDFC